MYKNISILLLRLMAIFMALPLISQLNIIIMSFAQPSAVFIAMTQVVFSILTIVIAVSLWIFAPLITRYTTANFTEDKNENKSDDVSIICNTILIAIGFLVLAGSFASYSHWITELLSNAPDEISIDKRNLYASIVYTILAAFLILSPQRVFNSIKTLKQRGSKTVKKPKK